MTGAGGTSAGTGPGRALGPKVDAQDQAGTDPSKNDLMDMCVCEIELSTVVDIKSKNTEATGLDVLRDDPGTGVELEKYTTRL
jgi:hypothetical protein